MAYYQFPKCNCKFKILGDNPHDPEFPLIEVDYHNINYDCWSTWHLLGQGFTKGIFQLDSPLGKNWCKTLKPENLEHISALGAILRPGTLKSKDERGVSMTQLYCRRKNKEEPVPSYHPVVDNILGPTYGVLCYQEQSIKLATDVALYNPEEADILRKAIGKKNTQLMSDNRQMFIEKATKAGIVSPEQSEEIFGWIEKSQRYSFNKSHAWRYGITGYWTAYIKAHFPLRFYAFWLYWSRNKADSFEEMRELITEAQLMNIEVRPPKLVNLKPKFFIKDSVIYYGLLDIKDVGQASVKSLYEIINQAPKKIENMSWLEFLVYIANKVKSKTVENLIRVGALPFNIPRQRMVYEYTKVWNELSDGEKKWIFANIDKFSCSNLKDILVAMRAPKKQGGGTSTDNRRIIIDSLIKLLENPPTQLVDTPLFTALEEEKLLGVSLSVNKIDGKDTSGINCFCTEFVRGKKGNLCLGGEITKLKIHRVQNGDNAGKDMAKINLRDSTGEIENIPVFTKTYEEHSHMLYEGGLVILEGYRKGPEETFFIKHIKQI